MKQQIDAEVQQLFDDLADRVERFVASQGGELAAYEEAAVMLSSLALSVARMSPGGLVVGRLRATWNKLEQDEQN